MSKCLRSPKSSQSRMMRVGRPLKPAIDGARYSLGLKVTAKAKRAIDSRARKTGQTQSQVAEELIMRALRERWLLDEICKLLTAPRIKGSTHAQS